MGPRPYAATGGPPAKSLTVRPLGLYARPPRQNFRRRGPARPRNRNFALRRFHVGRPCVALSGRPGATICRRGLRYRPQGWREFEKNRLRGPHFFLGGRVGAISPTCPKTPLALRERPVVETADVVVSSRRSRGRRSREVILAPRSRRAGRPETARRGRHKLKFGRRVLVDFWPEARDSPN